MTLSVPNSARRRTLGLPRLRPLLPGGDRPSSARPTRPGPRNQHWDQHPDYLEACGSWSPARAWGSGTTGWP